MEETVNGETEDEKTDVATVVDFTPTAPPCHSAPSAATLPALLYPDLSQLVQDACIQQMDNAFSTVTMDDSSEELDINVQHVRPLYLECIQQMEQTALESEREQLDALERQFVATENPHAVARDPGDYDSDLHLSLQTYRAAYHSYCEIVKERSVAQQQIASLRGRCWDFQQVKFSASGHCDDSRLVSVSIKSRVASLNVERCKEAKAEMSTMLDRCVTKEKEALIQLHHTRAIVEKNVSDPPIPGYERSVALRLKLRIIGNALRAETHQHGCDKGEGCEYVQDLRKWFIQLGTGMLRAGSVDERVWLMFHLLRFPNGTGTWAHVLVHPLPIGKPDGQLADLELHAILTLTHVLVRPIAERQTFLAPVDEPADLRPTPPANESKTGGDTFEWVDSDGEESSTDKRIRPIKESDLLALLDQIPFRRLFGSVTNRTIERVKVLDAEHLPTTEMLILTLFANKLIAILGEGLATYGGGIARYSHFAQRLALLINDTVKFVGDVMRFYREMRTHPCAYKHVDVVQIHFDTLVYRAARSIYSGGAVLVRHLSTLPFALLSSRACWWLFDSMLKQNFNQQPDFDKYETGELSLHDCPLMEQFGKNRSKENSAHDLYNVLKPMVDLALARDESADDDFMSSVAATLLELLAEIDAEELVWAEIIMEQIHILMERNPDVLSDLLYTLVPQDANRQQTVANGWQLKGNMLLKVFSSKKWLVMRWKPGEHAVTALIRMLLNYPRAHIYHKLSLGLLMYINYGDSGCYRVPKFLQVRIAYNIVVAFRKHQPPKTNPDGTVVVAVTAEQQTELRNYQERCLYVLLQLRLHAFDGPVIYMRSLLEEPSTVETVMLYGATPGAEVRAAIQEQCPVACLYALLASTMGHWVPVFCQDGTAALSVMYELHHLDIVVVRCLELITYLFNDYPLALANNSHFMAMLTKLVENDDVLDWARQTTGEHQQQHQHTLAMQLLTEAGMGKMGSMLVSQTAIYWCLGYATPPMLVCMWFDILAEINQWFNNAKVLRLLDVLATVSFGHADAWKALSDRFHPYFRSLSVVKHKQHTLWSKIVGIEQTMLYGTLPSDCVALALLVYGLEHRLERETTLWPRLLRTLKRNRTVKLDAALREIAGTLSIQEEDFCPAADSLVLFKLARFLVRANIEHPLYLGLCQLFFTLLLTRVSDVGDEVHGVADRLYDYDTGLMEKVKQVLCKLEVAYHCQQETNDDAQEMLRLVKAFQLWLVDTDLNRIDPDVPINLPSQYALNHLLSALNGSEEFWLECTNKQTFLAVTRMMIEGWYHLYRVVPNHSSAFGVITNQTTPLPPTQAIERRLENSYTDPQPIP
uniref:Epg5-like TPR domain-containing protein n=1 Tax=Anopheles stephensi TaxID=30069 RepID=A0A182XYE4_ANOST